MADIESRVAVLEQAWCVKLKVSWRRDTPNFSATEAALRQVWWLGPSQFAAKVGGL